MTRRDQATLLVLALAGLTCVWQYTVAGITTYIIKAGSLVQTWIRSTFINIHQTVIACRQKRGKTEDSETSLASSLSHLLSNPLSGKR